MRIASNWENYELYDCSKGHRLERWNKKILIRPDPQIIWYGGAGGAGGVDGADNSSLLWEKSDLQYIRSEKGGGYWQGDKFEDILSYKNFKFKIKPTDFKHMGIFPEQAVNWDFITEIFPNYSNLNVLNLFAYTGAMSVVCAANGANVTHVDASKGIVSWAKENAALNNIQNIRWIVDDCVGFVKREIRRNRKYDVIICDPPSYGRGANGEVWKFENDIFDFLKLCREILTEKPILLMINSYTTNISPVCMEFMADKLFPAKEIIATEIGLPIKTGGVLPCGNTTIVKFK